MYIIGGVKTCITIAVLFASGVWAQAANSCDRACMTGLVDRCSSQVSFFGVMKAWDKPLIIAMRLKVINGKTTEIEAMGVSLPYGTKSPWE